jgi:putative ABC transport system permease protein
MVTVVALTGGLALGAVLSKLAELGLVNLMGAEIDYRIRLDFKAVFRTVVCYVPFFALNAIAAVIRTRRTSAVNLLKAENAGEKPPKGNWLLAILGFIILGTAYWLALSITNPLDALMWFFVAVLLVIIATYMLFIAGSVWICRRLQNNKRYYYRPDHFVSVSSMAYRMKRNGAGLASICIIATMVLVMLSTTSCMMAGIENSILSRSPREINLHAWLDETSQLSGPAFVIDDQDIHLLHPLAV